MKPPNSMLEHTHNTRRRPYSVYDHGSEPDPRFTLANERTFLAWLRTSLALMAAGVGVEVLNRDGVHAASGLGAALSLTLLLAGVGCSAMAFARWSTTERALRTNKPLPPPRLGPFFGYGLALMGVGACFLVTITCP